MKHFENFPANLKKINLAHFPKLSNLLSTIYQGTVCL